MYVQIEKRANLDIKQHKCSLKEVLLPSLRHVLHKRMPHSKQGEWTCRAMSCCKLQESRVLVVIRCAKDNVHRHQEICNLVSRVPCSHARVKTKSSQPAAVGVLCIGSRGPDEQLFRLPHLSEETAYALPVTMVQASLADVDAAVQRQVSRLLSECRQPCLAVLVRSSTSGISSFRGGDQRL